MTFSAPSMNESGPKVADLAGQLLIITPTDYKTSIKTIHGDAEAVEVSLVNLDTNKTYDGVLFFNVALRNSLKQKIGQKVLARIGQGTAKPGKSAPWILLDATTDAAPGERGPDPGQDDKDLQTQTLFRLQIEYSAADLCVGRR